MRKVIIITRGLDKKDSDLIQVIKDQLTPKTKNTYYTNFKFKTILNYQII